MGPTIFLILCCPLSRAFNVASIQKNTDKHTHAGGIIFDARNKKLFANQYCMCHDGGWVIKAYEHEVCAMIEQAFQVWGSIKTNLFFWDRIWPYELIGCAGVLAHYHHTAGIYGVSCGTLHSWRVGLVRESEVWSPAVRHNSHFLKPTSTKDGVLGLKIDSLQLCPSYCTCTLW